MPLILALITHVHGYGCWICYTLLSYLQIYGTENIHYMSSFVTARLLYYDGWDTVEDGILHTTAQEIRIEY